MTALDAERLAQGTKNLSSECSLCKRKLMRKINLKFHFSVVLF